MLSAKGQRELLLFKRAFVCSEAVIQPLTFQGEAKDTSLSSVTLDDKSYAVFLQALETRMRELGGRLEGTYLYLHVFPTFRDP